MLDRNKELKSVHYGESGISCRYAMRPRWMEPAFLPHWHERMELILVEKGKIEFYLDQVPTSLCSGCLGVIPPQVLHGGICREEGTVFHVLMFEVERFQNGTGASEKWLSPLADNKLRFPAVVDDPETVALARRLVEMMTHPETSSLEAVGQLYILLGALCRASVPGSRIPAAKKESMRDVLDYIEKHFAEPLTVREISHLFSYNETHFCRRFKKTTGLTLMEYIRILRLEQAETLLNTEQAEIREIAWRCGFHDESYFSRAFKEFNGKSPREFRKANRENTNGK